MAKADGLIIAIKFTQNIVSASVEGNTGAFEISFNNYNWMPEGSLVEANRSVQSVTQDENDASLLYLTLPSGNVNSIQNAVGNVTVTYDASIGRLRGLGGPVASFSEDFTPNGLVAKDNPNTTEHIEVIASASATMIRIYYHDRKSSDEHLELSASASAVLTHIGDL